MKYIINYSNDTAFNIALEEYAFKHLLDEDQIFLLWINKPSIIVGRHQNTIEEINRDYVREHGIEVVRRISGGGAVYHDLNNLNYTIISKEDENLGVVYEEVDGGYVVDGDMFFEYYIVLTGKDPNAAHGTQFIVLTNDQHITYEQVSKSFLSSNSADSLSGTIVIGMKTID